MNAMLDSKKIYSFDLFDTLVCRSVQAPNDVFFLMERLKPIQYKNALYQSIGFFRLRRIAEIIARRKSTAEDVAFDEIYAVLAQFIDNAKEVQVWEFECELLVLHPIANTAEKLKNLLAQGEECCIISDMYLSLEHIKKIVNDKLGVDIPIFVSSEYKKTKHTGTLYEVVKNHYDVNYKDMVHCGDNLHADIKMAESLGMTAISVPNFNKKIADKNLFNILKPVKFEKTLPTDNVFYELGFYLAGPCAWAVAKWIADDLKDRGIKKVFFGARDGFIFEKFFKQISDIPCEYIRVSRRSLFLPTFGIDDSHNYLLFEGGDSLTATEFFERLNMVCPPELKEFSPNKNQPLFIEKLKELGFFEICNKELNDVLYYLKQVDFLGGKVAFFDLGWRGSLQSALQKIVGEKTQIFGYYFGLIKKQSGLDSHKAYYFYENTHSKRKYMLLQALAYFEFVFTEPVQSLKSIALQNKQIVFNYLDNDEGDDILAKRELIVQGAVDFVEIMQSFDDFFQISSLQYEQAVDKQVHYYINTPSMAIIDEFAKIEHSAAFGGTFVRHIVEKSPYSFKSYRQSFWRSGYVGAQLGFDKIKAKITHFLFYKAGMVPVFRMFRDLIELLKGK